MRKILFLTAAAGFFISGIASAQTAAPQASPYDKAPWWMKESVITQTGYVFTEIPANRANFSATFLTVADTAEKAQALAIAQTKGLNQALDKLGKDKVRISTSFSMRALYEQYRDKNGNRIEDQRGDKIEKYQVSLNLSVEVRDTDLLERAYALVLAAAPTSSTPINFYLQPDNDTNTWLYTEATKDAHNRALQSATAAGGKLGGIKVIDPTGRACETDILARTPDGSYDNTQAQEVDYKQGIQARMASPPPPPAPMVMGQDYAPGSAEDIEAKALQNPFIQTPPLQRLEAKSCVVYGLS
ncbi:MAG: SIMPL domain-containing protein [Asticcacaulis sp.]|uniref:SIMPL domain-containing protein n=1 Tax=Asticcacaulis sp. TaxID=1872648 RepID=UPI0039E3231E